jgi:hypothetical protein
MPRDPASQVVTSRRRSGWRLRILLGLNALLLGLFVLSRLDPTQLKLLGPWAESIHDRFDPPAVPDWTESGRRLKAEVEALGGSVQRSQPSGGFLGLFGDPETFYVLLNGTQVHDEQFARLVQGHGDRIWGLDLRHTRISDEGLRHLKELPDLQQLVLGNDDPRFLLISPLPSSPITDAGLVHLRNLPSLTSLNLSGLPISDAGLEAIGNLPKLGWLDLSRTRVRGPGLSRLKWLPKLAALRLDGCEVTEAGLSQLAGASNLQSLSLSEVPLTCADLPPLKALPRLEQLEIRGCGLLDEDLEGLRMSKPRLKIER